VTGDGQEEIPQEDSEDPENPEESTRIGGKHRRETPLVPKGGCTTLGHQRANRVAQKVPAGEAAADYDPRP